MVKRKNVTVSPGKRKEIARKSTGKKIDAPETPKTSKTGTVYRAFIEMWHKKGTLVYKGTEYNFIARMQGARGLSYILAKSNRDFNLGNYIYVKGNSKIMLK